MNAKYRVLLKILTCTNKRNCSEAFGVTPPSYCDVLTNGTGNTKTSPADIQKNVNHFVINGLHELGNIFNARVESDATIIAEIVQHMSLKSENNITSARRLGKSQIANNERRMCRPLLIATNNAHFMDRCFARRDHLKECRIPVNVKKFPSSSDREIKKKVLAKRYQMINLENKEKKYFRIKQLQLY